MKNLINYIKETYNVVPENFRRKVKTSFILNLLNGVLDVISLAALIPVVLIFLDPAKIKTNPITFDINQNLGFTQEFSFQIFMLISLVLLFIIKNVISIRINYYLSKTAFDISTALSKRSLYAFFQQPYLDFTKSNSAIVSRKIKTAPNDFSNYVLVPQISIVTETIIGSIIIIAISFYSPAICLLLVIVMLPVLLIWRWFKKMHVERVEDDFKKKYPASLKYLLQGVDSYIDVKLYQKEGFFTDKFIALKSEMNSNYAWLKTASFIPSKILEVVLVSSIALIFAYTSFVNTGIQLIPLLSLFIAGFYRLYPSVTRILNALATVKAYHYVLDELQIPEPATNSTTSTNIGFKESIQFEQVCFSYPGKEPLFNNINLKLCKGQCVGISGESGSGKTTLVKLLTGLIKPDSGLIIVDGVELVSEQRNFAKIGYLQQQPVIIDATLVENIAFGEHEFNSEKLASVIRQANLGSFIESLPDKLQTHLGENGLQISGGQRQRIALARALYRDAEVLIFDEISNNLDKGNLLEICTSIAGLLATGKTIILIDHDSMLLELADKVWEVGARGTIYEKEKDLSRL